MTSLASREMTEQEMINTCTAPQMAHLIQVLRQTIRNKDKEIERWVDMVRDGELDPPEPKPRLAEPETPTLCAKCNDHIIADDGAVCEICAETMDTIITELQTRIAELEADIANLQDWLGAWKESLDISMQTIAKYMTITQEEEK